MENIKQWILSFVSVLEKGQGLGGSYTWVGHWPHSDAIPHKVENFFAHRDGIVVCTSQISVRI
jgi:hypothetical protein